jgi:hypothetical protein
MKKLPLRRSVQKHRDARALRQVTDNIVLSSAVSNLNLTSVKRSGYRDLTLLLRGRGKCCFLETSLRETMPFTQSHALDHPLASLSNLRKEGDEPVVT